MEGYRVAEWFIIYNNLFTVLSIIISLAISWFAYRVYRITKQWKTGIFSLAFLFIGIGHMFFFTPFLLRFTLEISPRESLIFPISVITFTLLYLIGATLLLSTTLKVWQWTVPSLILAISTIGIVLGPRPDMMMHLVTAVLFLFIAAYYLRNYLRHKEVSTFIVLSGFVLLLVGNAMLVLSHGRSEFFEFGRILQLLGYIAFLVNLVLVLKK